MCKEQKEPSRGMQRHASSRPTAEKVGKSWAEPEMIGSPR